jgi:pilus assembly protein CpaB
MFSKSTWGVVALGIGVSFFMAAGELAAQQAGEKTEAVVAIKDIAAGTVIKDPESFFKKVRIPKELDLASAVRNLDQLKGKVLLRALDQNQIVSTRDLRTPDELAAKLPAGQRAMTIRAEVDKEGAGFILPGSKVDVIVTVPDKDNKEKTVSKIALQNLLVLAIDAGKEKAKDDKRLSVLITLAVTPENAEKLTAITKDQVPYLVLRAPDEK